MLYESNYYGVCDFGDSLEHHGILGQKWGVRRYQNKDGTLTAAGKRRYKQIFERGSEDPLYEVSVKRAADKALKSGRIKGYDDDDTADLYDLAVEEALDKDSNIRKHSFLKDDIVSEYQKAKSEERAQKIQNVKDSVKSGIETAKVKAAEFKQAQEERKAASIEKKKEKAIEKGDAKTLLKYSDTMTTNDINNALNRMAAEKRLKDLAYPDRKSTLEKITDAAGTLSSMGNKVVNLKNTYDNLKRAFAKEEDPGDALYNKHLAEASKQAMLTARKNTEGSVADKEYAAYKVAKEMASARSEFEKRERAEEKAKRKAEEEERKRKKKGERLRREQYLTPSRGMGWGDASTYESEYYGVCDLEGNSLWHHGILGQKWGIRRFQNKDGSLTSAGAKRYGSDKKKDKKSVDDNSVEAVAKRIQKADLLTENNIQRNGRRAIQASELGLEALTETYSYYDFKKPYSTEEIAWFIFEDQTIGCLTLADQINRGKSPDEVKKLVKDANALPYDEYAYKEGFFQLREAYEADKFIDACHRIKTGKSKS